MMRTKQSLHLVILLSDQNSHFLQLHRSRREAELSELQRCVEEETRRHEIQLSEVRVKHSAALDSLQEQLDNGKRVRETQKNSNAHAWRHAQSLTVSHPCSASGTTVP